MNPEDLQKQLDALFAQLLVIQTRQILIESQVRAVLLNQAPRGTPPASVCIGSEEWSLALDQASSEMLSMSQALGKNPPTPPSTVP